MSRRIESSRQRFAEYRERLRKKETLQPDLAASLRRRPRVPLDLGSGPQLLPALGRSTAGGLFFARDADDLDDSRAGPARLDEIRRRQCAGQKAPAAGHPELAPRATAIRGRLLLFIVVAVTVLNLVKVGLQVWGRWYATRSTKRLQLSIRKRAFEHAVRLPLHRVHELKSGGVASVLREDAGSVGELIFGMLYNPWRAIVQLVGSLIILAWADWRLLTGALVLVPAGFPDASHVDQPHSSAAQGHPGPPRIDRRPHDRIVQRHARRARIQP